jgi:hypothetical protein
MIGQQLYDPFGTGGVTSVAGVSPIVGDPEPVIQLAPTYYLTSGDLASGDSGEAGGLANMAIEMWFHTSSVTPTGGDFIAYGPVADGSNRQWQLELGATGLVTFLVRSASLTNLSVTAAASLLPSTWYHLVGSLTEATSRDLYINGSLAASAGWNDSIQVSDFTAGSSDLRIGDAAGVATFRYADIAFYRHSLSAARVLAHFTAGLQRGFPTQNSGSRISAVLDSVGSKAPRRIGTGVRSLTDRYMTGQAPLDAIREARAAEAVDSVFFSAADGTLVFLAADHRSSSPYNTVQATFGDGAGELPYVDVTIDYSDSFLTNEYSITREGSAKTPGQTQTASDAASIARYLKRPQSGTGLPLISDTDSANIAAALLAKYKTPLTRITSISFTTALPDVTEALFRRELGDKIRVLRTPPGGGARISQDLWIQKVEISGANDAKPWSVRWGVSPV